MTNKEKLLMEEIEFLWLETQECYKDGFATGGLFAAIFILVIWALSTF